MKKSVRRVISIASLVAFSLGFVAVIKMTAADRSLKTCDGVNLIYTDEYRFVDLDDVKGWLDKGYGTYIGQRLDSIQLHKVEKVLNAQSAILKTEAYVTDDGKLNVSISQREPVLRFQTGDYGFYADVNGYIFPLQDNYTKKVPVVDGNLPINCPKGYKGAPRSEEERLWVNRVISMASYIQDSKLWNGRIVQIHVDENGDLILIPRDGNERFIFGSPTGVDDKLSRMEKYYKYILPEKGQGYYKTVNLKFDKQIICKK